jgi:hypothetical protein
VACVDAEGVGLLCEGVVCAGAFCADTPFAEPTAAGGFWRELFCSAKLERTNTDMTTTMSLARFNSVAPEILHPRFVDQRTALCGNEKAYTMEWH